MQGEHDLMAEYLDREQLLQYATSVGAYGFISAEDIKNFPAADVAEVVRRRDCEHYRKNDANPVCLVSQKGDAFCSEGKRTT